MRQGLWASFVWWLCDKFNHPWIYKGWVYNGMYHRECRICKRTVSEPVK